VNNSVLIIISLLVSLEAYATNKCGNLFVSGKGMVAVSGIQQAESAITNYINANQGKEWRIVQSNLQYGSVNRLKMLSLVKSKSVVKGLTLSFDQNALMEFFGKVIKVTESADQSASKIWNPSSDVYGGEMNLEVLILESNEGQIFEVPIVPGMALFEKLD
jgi:hypothetical protein